MHELVYCFEKLEKTVIVDDNFITPVYGQKINIFNGWFRVIGTDPASNKINIKLERFE